MMWTTFLRNGVIMNGLASSKLLTPYKTNVYCFKTLFTCQNRSRFFGRTNFLLVGSRNRTNLTQNKKVEGSSKNELLRLIQLAKSEKWRISGAVVLLLISSSVTMAIPYCLGKVIDMLSLPSDELKAKLSSFCQLLIVIFFIGALANFGRVYLINLSSYSITNSLRKKTYNSILHQEISFFDKTKTGELINRISSDTSVVGLSVTNNISDGLRSTFSFLAGTSLMIYTSPQLAAYGLLTVSPVALFAVFYGRYLKRVTRTVQDSLASATQVAEEKISNIRTVHAFAQQEKEKKLYSEKVNQVLHFATKESLGRALFFGLSGFSGNLIALTVLYSGGIMMTDNLITIGSLSSFLMYAAYVGISIGGLSTCYAELMRGLGASTRLWYLIERQPSVPLQNGIILHNLRGDIEFSGINFAYPSRPNVEVLSSFNLSIPAGTIYAIVGPSGSGKSTLAFLLLRFYDCSHGSVTIDGNDVKTLHLNWLRENVGLVSQEPILFSSTVRENVCYGAKDQPGADLEKVLKEANAWDFISAFPNGLDTVVGEKGSMLSGGQRQRIAIARALLKNPKILVLDEATSALDTHSESLVQSALEKLMEGRTVLTIAHRLSTIRKAHRIAVLDQGHIVEEGHYEDLLNKQGLFYRLVQHQTVKD